MECIFTLNQRVKNIRDTLPIRTTPVDFEKVSDEISKNPMGNLRFKENLRSLGKGNSKPSCI